MSIRTWIAAAGSAVLMLAAPAAYAQVGTGTVGDLENETVLSGYVGSAFGGELDDQSVSFGGSLSWLWSSIVGAEVMAGFAPQFSLTDADLDDTQINNYMVNAIAAVPIGEERQWQPFVSGGVGALTLQGGSDVEADLGIAEIDETELGGNLGFGLMAFADRWGFRGDVRYFSQLGDPETTDTAFLNDVDFWRTNVGLSYRW